MYLVYLILYNVLCIKIALYYLILGDKGKYKTYVNIIIKYF